MKKNQLSRREFIQLSATVAAGSLLAACGPAATPAPTAKPAATSAPAAQPTAAVACPKGDICIKPTTVKLPQDKVTFRWLDSGDTKAVFMKAFFEKYQQAYPSITCQYDGLPWNEIAKIVPLGIQNGNLHDCFSIPMGITGGQAVAEGWVRPLDDLIPDLAKLKESFPPGSFVEGINVFNGKTYTLPFGTNMRSGTLLLYNTEYLQKAGYDPTAKPLSWDDYRAAAKKVTEQGAGKYYGIIIGGNQLNRWGAVVGDMARLSGVSVVEDNFDARKGEYFFSNDLVVAAIELLLAIKADGSFFPGIMSLNAPQARAQIAQGAAGMILQGLWCLPQWQKENPTFKYGVGLTPTQSGGGKFAPLHAGPGGNNEHWVYAKAKNPEVVADIFYYRGTLEGQLAWNKIAGVSDPGIFPKAVETASSNPADVKALELQSSMHRVGPTVVVRNPDAAKVSLERKAVTPSFEQVIQGLVSGQVTGVKKAMQDVKDAYEKELDRAIKAAQDKGAKVSRADYVFPNWDPNKSYLEADYQALKK